MDLKSNVMHNFIVEEVTLNSNIVDKPKPLVRESSVELLRIICMILIISHHFINHAGLTFAPDYFGINRFLVQLFDMGGKVGVNIFVLITGYFSISSFKYSTSKSIRLWLQAFFYSILIFIIFTATGLETFSWQSLAQNILIVTTERWWFFSAYFILLVFSPVLNLLLNKIPRTGYKLFVFTIFIFYSLIPTFIWTNNFFTANWSVNSVIWFIFIYSLGGYIKLYGMDFGKKASTYLLLGIGIYALIYASIIVMDFIGPYNEFVYQHTSYFAELQTIPCLFASIFIFVGFKNINMKPSKIINFASGLTFGIYLIHDNKILREYLWKQWIPTKEILINSPYFVLYGFAAIATVFILGAIIETIRKYALERFYMIPINKFCHKVDRAFAYLFRNKSKNPTDSVS